MPVGFVVVEHCGRSGLSHAPAAKSSASRKTPRFPVSRAADADAMNQQDQTERVLTVALSLHISTSASSRLDTTLEL
jgi:hypothetical protein